MSTRQTTAHELAQRAKAVGWKVTNPRSMGGAYKITMTPCEMEECKHIINVHLTSSDINAARVIVRDMNAHGLAGLEKAATKRRAAERMQKIEAGRVEAERAAAALIKQAQTMNRAAGPYAGPELVEDAWFLGEHPAPWFRWVVMMPDQARRLLDKLNTNNRPLSEGQVEHYRGVVQSGQWHQTHQGMAIDRNVVLQDGQHRLAAIAQAGIPVPVAFFVGMDPENFKAIDEGLVRTAAQLFSRDGETYTVVLQGMLKLIYAMSGTDPRRDARKKLTNEQLYDMFGANMEELRKSADFGGRHAKRAYASPTALAAAHYLLRKANGRDNPYVEAFLTGYVNGRKSDDVSMHPDDPRLRLREYMMNVRASRKRVSALDSYALTVNTWNHLVNNRRVAALRWADNMQIPKIDLCVPGDGPNGVLNQCPDMLRGEIPHTVVEIPVFAAA